MQDLDPKLYPLASTPTPSSLRNISFDLGGKQTIFKEAEDTTVAMEEIEQENQILKSNGALRTVQTFKNEPRDLSSSFGPPPQRPIPRERPASPDSIVDQAEPGRNTRSTTATRRVDSSSRGPSSLPRLRKSSRGEPATPEIDLRERRKKGRRSLVSSVPGSTSKVDASPLSSFVLKHHTPALGSAHDMSSTRPTSSHGFQTTPSSCRPTVLESQCSAPSHSHSQTSAESVVPTPPIQGDERQFVVPPARRNLSSIPSRLAAVDTSLAQDGSLPSPSLSPVTAAANLQNAGYFADIDSNSEMASQQDHEMSESSQFFDPDSAQRIFEFPTPQKGPQLPEGPPPVFEIPKSSINDIPAMLDFFEAIPDELKSYVMHQLLRRCPKPALRLVADVVNTALRCDFVGLLPPELSLNILKYLDARSLCRASQVSRKWRHLVNGDEQAWKDLFDADGLSLPQGELKRAIVEGWGWQDPVGVDGWEQDISAASGARSESDTSLSTSTMLSNVGQRNGRLAVTGNVRRPKRKAVSKLSHRNKQLKRRDTSSEISEKLESITGATE